MKMNANLPPCIAPVIPVVKEIHGEMDATHCDEYSSE
jgi:hypothetical protein